MGLVARPERQLDLGLGERDVHPLAVVLDRDDVDALLGDPGQELRERARPVSNLRPQDKKAPSCVSP